MKLKQLLMDEGKNIVSMIIDSPVIPPTVKLFGFKIHTIEKACITQPIYTIK